MITDARPLIDRMVDRRLPEDLWTLEQAHAHLDALSLRLPHTPEVHCYVLGCRTTPYLCTRHKLRAGRIVQTCRDHDPARYGCDLPWEAVRDARMAQNAPQTTQDTSIQQQSELELYRKLFRQFLGLDAGSDSGQGGTRRPVAPRPTRPTPPTTAADIGF